jgi:GntR family transcriptional regulator
MQTMELKRRAGIPLYMQIRDLLIEKIQSGKMRENRLPPVRSVAETLGVNPNTVLRAYNELSKEGYVNGAVGKGTFISTSPYDLRKQNRRELLLKAIEHSLEEALSLEFTIDEYEHAVRDYIQDKKEHMHNIRLIFIECNVEQLTYFTEHLDIDPHIQRVPVLLDDIRLRDKEALKKVRSADIIVTSFYHLDEVRKYFVHMKKPIVGINLEPEVTTLIEIAKIDPNRTVGIVTSSLQCRKEITEILINTNIHFNTLLQTNSSDPDEIDKLVKSCSAVLVSPHQKELVQKRAYPGTKVIEFVFSPDKTSINNLKVATLELTRGAG